MPESRGFQPTAWSAKTRSHVFKPVVPRAEHGMHVNLHRNLSARYRRHDTVKDPLCYRPTFKIIYHQRQPQRVFSAQGPGQAYPIDRVTRRLACFDPVRGPPESCINPEGAAPFFPYLVCTKPMYSAEEVDRIVQRLYTRKREEGRCPPRLLWHHRRKSYPAEMLEEVLDMYCSSEKLCDTQPLRNATRHRVKVLEDIAASRKKYSQDDVRGIVERLSDYNPNTWPPNSKGVIPPEAEPSVKVKYPSTRAPSQAYLDDVVSRLYSGKIDPDAYKYEEERSRRKSVRAKTVSAAQQKRSEEGEIQETESEQEMNKNENNRQTTDDVDVTENSDVEPENTDKQPQVEVAAEEPVQGRLGDNDEGGKLKSENEEQEEKEEEEEEEEETDPVLAQMRQADEPTTGETEGGSS